MNASSCSACGESLAGGEFCPQCGARQKRSVAVDPLIGRVFADRYEVLELLREGGMSRVYRAVQRSLARPVALKIVEPSKLPGVLLEEVTSRFMREARTASQLNHPNVVSIFDFGRELLDGEWILFLAMEVLSGPSLGQLLSQPGEPLSFARIAEILRHTLAALGEAHHMGITHRDVKPDNIVFDRDRVKVIDFGIARVEATTRLTDAGRVMGTPHYVAPESVDGATGPSVDLYAVGVILFELLTGRVPFDHRSAVEVVRMHTAEPRPDPRSFAPDRRIPPALAEVCIRAMAFDPIARYADAEALAQAISQASSESWTPAHSSLFPAASSSRDRPTDAPPAADIPIASPSQPLMSAGPALIGRAGHMAWARAELTKPAGLSAIVLWGAPGMGKTRILSELAARAHDDGAIVIEVAVEPLPRSEVGFGHVRALITKLGGHVMRASDESPDGRREVADALRDAVRGAVARAKGSYVVVAIDDADRADGVSRALVDELLTEPTPGFVILMTRGSAPSPHVAVRDMPLTGLSRSDARRLVNPTSATAQRVAAPEARGSDRLVEPLYLEQFLRWRAEHRSAKEIPTTLAGIVGSRVDALAPPERRALQAVAVVGGGTADEIASLVERPDEIASALVALAAAGFLRRDGDAVSLAHVIFGLVALRDAPAGAIEQIHTRAADALAGNTQALELRAWHAIRGRPDFEAFALIEEAARVRAMRGDHVGAIASLSDGYVATRTCMARFEERVASAAWIVFGRKLADALVRTGQLVEARGILSELLQATGPMDAARAPILETLARIAEMSGRDDEAARLRDQIRESTPMMPATPSSRHSSVEPTTSTRRKRPRDRAPPSSRGTKNKTGRG